MSSNITKYLTRASRSNTGIVTNMQVSSFPHHLNSTMRIRENFSREFLMDWFYKTRVNLCLCSFPRQHVLHVHHREVHRYQLRCSWNVTTKIGLRVLVRRDTISIRFTDRDSSFSPRPWHPLCIFCFCVFSPDNMPLRFDSVRSVRARSARILIISLFHVSIT